MRKCIRSCLIHYTEMGFKTQIPLCILAIPDLQLSIPESDLQNFVKLLGFTLMESLIAATCKVVNLFIRENELRKF